MTNPTTRRALISGAATLGAVALPAAALATVTTDDARFLAWEREAARIWDEADQHMTDDERNDLMDVYHDVEGRILHTKAPGLTPARVRASTLALRLEHAEDDDRCLKAVLEIVAALRAAGAD